MSAVDPVDPEDPVDPVDPVGSLEWRDGVKKEVAVCGYPSSTDRVARASKKGFTTPVPCQHMGKT